MEFCLEITPDETLKRSVDSLRYHYDRKLIKEKSPYINIFGPIKNFVNLKRLSTLLNGFMKKQKRFKLTADVVGLYGNDAEKVFLNIFHKGKMKEIYNFIKQELMLVENPDYFPHIILAENHTHEELQTIYGDLDSYNTNYTFLAEEINIKIKDGKYWENYSTCKF